MVLRACNCTADTCNVLRDLLFVDCSSLEVTEIFLLVRDWVLDLQDTTLINTSKNKDRVLEVSQANFIPDPSSRKDHLLLIQCYWMETR